MKIILLAALALVTTDCKTALSPQTIAVDLTGALCTALDNQPVGQPWVDVVCTIAKTIETAAAGDAGTPTAPQVRQVIVRVPAEQSAAFLAAHAAH